LTSSPRLVVGQCVAGRYCDSSWIAAAKSFLHGDALDAKHLGLMRRMMSKRCDELLRRADALLHHDATQPRIALDSCDTAVELF